MATGRYLIVFKGLDSVVPKSLRDFVRKTIGDAFGAFEVELDFAGSKASRDLLVVFTREMVAASVNGESNRQDNNGTLESATSLIFVSAMKAIRIQSGAGGCAPVYQETTASLGSIIANTTIHEIGHMLGLRSGGIDDGGHTSDPDNYMWSSLSLGLNDLASSPFVYTVKQGDTMSSILRRYADGTLDKCRVGPTRWTYMDAWQDEDNSAPGFVADPKKSGVPGRRANDPNWIYPGERVALPNFNLRTQAYRLKMRGFLGAKSFTNAQKDAMQRFIAARLAAGKG